MEAIQVERAYQELVAQYGALPSSSAHPERRQHPRFRVHTRDLWVNDVPEFQVRDVSASGIGLEADFPLQQGDRLKVCLRDDIHAQAVVLGCELMDSGSQYWAPLFQINCRFEDEHQGKALVVMTKRAEQQLMDQALA